MGLDLTTGAAEEIVYMSVQVTQGGCIDNNGCDRIIIWEWQVSTGRLGDIFKDVILIVFTIHEYRYKGEAASK
jgi:hypothetical protein